MNAAELRKFIPGYFTVQQVSDAGGKLLTIKTSGVEAVGQDKDEKPVLSFLETREKLVLNASRCQQLADLFGEADVAGKKVRLGVETIKGINQIVIASGD